MDDNTIDFLQDEPLAVRPPKDAREYFHTDYLRAVGLEGDPSPELWAELDKALAETVEEVRGELGKVRNGEKQSRLHAEYALAVNRARQEHADLARIAVEYEQRGMGRLAEVPPNDAEVWATINERAAQIVQNARERTEQADRLSKNDRLWSSFKSELSKIPRGRLVEIQQLEEVYKAKGLDFSRLPGELPPPEPAARQDNAVLRAAFEAEKARIRRGDIFHINQLEAKYRAAGLDI